MILEGKNKAWFMYAESIHSCVPSTKSAFMAGWVAAIEAARDSSSEVAKDIQEFHDMKETL